MKLDFHVHSTASDGTLAPGELARRAMARGFAAIALTDHDNCDGIDEFLAYEYNPDDAPETEILDETLHTPNPDVRRIVGIEISIEPGEGFDKFHLLGLGIDPRNEGLRSFLSRILKGRNERNERILGNFESIGIRIPREEIASYAHGDVLARPHFAKWLLDHGYGESIRDNFEKYLLPDSPDETRCYENRYHPSQEEAFRVVHEAGGLCIMAHPKYWRNEWRLGGVDYEGAQRELLRLKEIGLDGIEALYQANFPREDVAWVMIAERTGLLKSVGSDYHGANKPNIRLGMSVEPMYIQPLMERLA